MRHSVVIVSVRRDVDYMYCSYRPPGPSLPPSPLDINASHVHMLFACLQYAFLLFCYVVPISSYDDNVYNFSFAIKKFGFLFLLLYC